MLSGIVRIHSRCLLSAARGICHSVSIHGESSSSHASSIPLAIIQALTDHHASKIAINKLPDLGRALIASSDLDYGSTIFTESPLVCYPNPLHSETVCYHCLKVLLSTSSVVSSRLSGQRFCSESCSLKAERLYHHAEALAASSDDCSLRALEASCESEGERFPLMVARLAFGRISQAAHKMVGMVGTVKSSPPTDPPPDPNLVAGDPLLDIPFLCFANIPKPYPPRWIDLYSLLSKAMESSVDLIEQQMVAPRGSESPSLMRIELEIMDLDWFVRTLSRFHLNTFRVGCLVPSEGGGLALGQTTSGSATFLLGSLLNHSCEPNVEPIFRRQDATVSFIATRDIQKGEALLVSYLDETLPVDQRQKHLEFAYGFKCRCFKCIEEGS